MATLRDELEIVSVVVAAIEKHVRGLLLPEMLLEG
jgi:hypothetical protein